MPLHFSLRPIKWRPALGQQSGTGAQQRGLIASAGAGADAHADAVVEVRADLEPERVAVVDQLLHALRETVGVDLRSAGGVVPGALAADEVYAVRFYPSGQKEIVVEREMNILTIEEA